MAAPAKAAQRKMRDEERAAAMKRLGIERRTGICAVCYRVISNDTFGGRGAFNHYPAACLGHVGKGV